jgi:hypothetical protein
VGPTGEPLPRQFPGPAPLTPATIPCGQRVAPVPADWANPTWQALRFQPTDALRFSYQFESSGTGPASRFIVSATTDSDCDGITAVYRMTGSVTASGNVQGLSSLAVENEGE